VVDFPAPGTRLSTGGSLSRRSLIAAGAVAVVGAVERAPRRWLTVAAATFVVSLPFTAPVLPVSVYNAVGGTDINKELGEQLGWQELTDQVVAVYRSLPADQRADVRIISGSYGEAGAIEIYGPARGLPSGIVLSGQNSYHDWWPDDAPTGAVITVRVPIERLSPLFAGCRQVATITNAEDVDTRDYGLPIGVCDRPLASPVEIREALRIYS